MAIVKAVTSGDSLVLRGRAVSGPPPEKVVYLGLIAAPRRDQKFYFESKDFTRKLVIGQDVEFIGISSKKDVGSVLLKGENIAKIIVKHGWANVKTGNDFQELDDLHKELLELEKSAKLAKIGIFSKSTPIKISNTIPVESRDFLEKYKNIQIPGVVELVRDASTFRVLLNLDNERILVTLGLAGVKTPVLRRGIPNVQDLVEPFAEEAKFMVESRLGQRDVHVLLQGLPSNPSPPGSPNPLFFGTIVYPLGNISQVLLDQGFAKINDWTLGMLTGGETYRIAERNAKLKKIRIWKDYEVKSSLNLEASSFSGLVIRILGPDLIQIENVKTGQEQKVQLSSVRGPKRQKNDAGLETGYFSEAVEFLRSRLVGKTVQVTIDYVKPAEGEYEARTCVTILNGDQNIAEALISRGLAQVIRHKKDDENRSSKYDVLLIAEERAQTSQKGVWSPKDAPTIRISDVSESLAKAKQFLPFLQKSGEIGGIVEYCASGSRFRILVPSQSVRITLVLGGIRVPRAGGGISTKAEPFGPEALNFVNKNVLQRDVTFSAENVDKSGGIIGTLWVEKNNVAVSLLELGYGYVHDYSASQSAYSTALYEAEAIAKNSRIGVWKDFDPNAAIDEISSSIDTLVIDQKNVVVSEFSKDSLFIQVMGSDAKKLEKMMSTFSESYNSSNSPITDPKVGDYCAAKFSADNQWYRAQITGISGSRVTVRYIDYGNCETLPLSSLCKLLVSHSTKTLPAQAIKVNLAHLEFPIDDDDASFFKAQSILENSEFRAKMTDQSNVLLYPPGSKTSVNEVLLKSGHCFLKPSSVSLARETHKKKLKSGLGLEMLQTKDDLQVLLEAQDEAKREHLNIWRYGDFQDDD